MLEDARLQEPGEGSLLEFDGAGLLEFEWASALTDLGRGLPHHDAGDDQEDDGGEGEGGIDVHRGAAAGPAAGHLHSELGHCRTPKSLALKTDLDHVKR